MSTIPPRIAKEPCFLDRVLARKTGVDKQVGKVLRIDLRSRPNLERRAQQALGTADPCRRAQRRPR